MDRVRPIALLVALAVLSTSASVLAQGHVIDEGVEPRFMFVVSGSSGQVEDETLMLDGVSSVVYFSDRPARIAGHMSVTDFVTNWSATAGADSFAFDPPNAVLSVLGDDGEQDVVIELTDVEVDGDSLAFGIEVLSGVLPLGPFGPASLFIDDLLGSCSSGGPCSG